MVIRLATGYRKEGVIARFLGPLGVYPSHIVGDKEHGYLYSRSACLSVVRVREHPGQYEAYSEMEWAYPEEIAFYASIAFAYNDDGHRITLYPLPDARGFTVDGAQRLNAPDVLAQVKSMLVEAWKAEEERRSRILPSVEHWQQPYALPPFADPNTRYTISDAIVPARQKELLRAIDPSDFLLIRGLSTWLRSAMLSQHMLFMEEAITTLFISMEASFRLVCRHLSANGSNNPNAHDAAVFVGQAFNEQPLERYFEEYYDDRIATLHPESRFGIFPHAPLMADDYYHLRDSLRYLYIYLLTGEVVEDV